MKGTRVTTSHFASWASITHRLSIAKGDLSVQFASRLHAAANDAGAAVREWTRVTCGS